LEDWAPACCGSGCAVCVLDTLDEFPQPKKREEAVDDPAALCCESGCTVCVLDLANPESQADAAPPLERLLAAFEGAVAAGGSDGGPADGERGARRGEAGACALPSSTSA
jgi:hypothetical protein